MGLSEKMFRQPSVSSAKIFPGITKAAGKLQSPRPYLLLSCYSFLILFYKRLYFLVDALCIQSILLNQFQSRTGLSEHIVDTDLHDFRRLLLRHRSSAPALEPWHTARHKLRFPVRRSRNAPRSLPLFRSLLQTPAPAFHPAA